MKSMFPNKERKSSPIQSTITDKGETITGKPTIVKTFKIFFTNTVSKLLESVQPTTIPGLSYQKFTNESFVLQPVSQNFIFKQLKDLKGKRASGLYGILARFLKDGASVIAPTVTFLVNLSLSTGTALCDWKMAHVIPLYKLGGRESMDNYRPISKLPVLSKIMEKAVNNQLQWYLQRFDLLCPFQSGFRQHHSMESAVIYFMDEIRRSAELGKLTGALFIDLGKAFDSVPHKEL